MNELKMLTQEEVAELCNTHVSTISVLRELEIIRATRIGRSYMFSQDEIRNFQREYAGLDVSNKYKAILSRSIVEERHAQERIA